LQFDITPQRTGSSAKRPHEDEDREDNDGGNGGDVDNDDDDDAPGVVLSVARPTVAAAASGKKAAPAEQKQAPATPSNPFAKKSTASVGSLPRTNSLADALNGRPPSAARSDPPSLVFGASKVCHFGCVVVVVVVVVVVGFFVGV
jgi:hypothetical protein